MYEEVILKIYQKCKITSFPIDCDRVLSDFGYRIRSYAEASRNMEQLKTLHSYSSDAFTDHTRKIIYYNDRANRNRIRFSKMHELGHVVLETDDDEKADSFASNFLAPRPVIFAKQLLTADQISRTFRISTAAANKALISKMYAPDENGMKIIDHFGERSACPWPFNLPPSPEDLPFGFEGGSSRPEKEAPETDAGDHFESCEPAPEVRQIEVVADHPTTERKSETISAGNSKIDIEYHIKQIRRRRKKIEKMLKQIETDYQLMKEYDPEFFENREISHLNIMRY